MHKVIWDARDLVLQLDFYHSKEQADGFFLQCHCKWESENCNTGRWAWGIQSIRGIWSAGALEQAQEANPCQNPQTWRTFIIYCPGVTRIQSQNWYSCCTGCRKLRGATISSVMRYLKEHHCPSRSSRIEIAEIWVHKWEYAASQMAFLKLQS